MPRWVAELGARWGALARAGCGVARAAWPARRGPRGVARAGRRAGCNKAGWAGAARPGGCGPGGVRARRGAGQAGELLHTFALV
ncbi:hypothetical protein, partial [Micromonospora sp. NPDC048843]|uniref:hypothetical protein n=1 Tax=Micromonospora sp. NPDC048843 TaxID=3155389 RepID=UPI0033FC2305